ncbi:MAG: tryptophan--tRNA ligase [Clostridia bacterium]|jgi:tryptophanyl-tRNA synthetase|nr:tryptophan--tRNA ligase [Clostridia bacterium]
MEKKIILSGIQATGTLTLGNYLGALNNWVEMQDKYDCYYMIADLHTLTIRNDPEILRKNTLNLIALYIAAGLDPEKNTIFIQSHIPAHTQLSWVLNCYTYMGELNRMTQYKDKCAKHADNINSGLFTYPVLMAADILIYNADLVPVGQDQKQHLEIARDIAERFNSIYGETFKMPEPYIGKVGAKIMGLQNPTSKMSKSAEDPMDKILLSDTKEDIIKKFKKAVTDSENKVRFDVENKPGVSNLMVIYSIIKNKTIEEVEKEFEGQGYGNFKTAVAEAVIERLEPLQKRYNELLENPKELMEICNKGTEKASKKANTLLKNVYKKVGLVINE